MGQSSCVAAGPHRYDVDRLEAPGVSAPALNVRKRHGVIISASEGYFLSHKFSVGQLVELAPRLLQAAGHGQYEVRQLMPLLDQDPSDPIYRIKSADEKHERVAAESDLTLSALAD